MTVRDLLKVTNDMTMINIEDLKSNCLGFNECVYMITCKSDVLDRAILKVYPEEFPGYSKPGITIKVV